MIDVAASVPGPSLLFQVFVFLHVLCAIGGFGGLVYRGLALDMARRKGQASTAGTLDVYGQISTVAEFFVYGVLIFGIAAVAAEHGSSALHRPWLPLAVADYIVVLGLLHGLVHPAERRYRAALLELAQMPAMAPPARPPQLAETDRLYKRVGAGTAGINILLVGALYLMVFTP